MPATSGTWKTGLFTDSKNLGTFSSKISKSNIHSTSEYFTFSSFTRSILLPYVIRFFYQTYNLIYTHPLCTNEKIDCNRKTIYRGYNWSMRTLCLKERFFVYLLFPEIFSIVTLVSRKQNLLMTGSIYLTITIFVRFFFAGNFYVKTIPRVWYRDIHNDIEPEST